MSMTKRPIIAGIIATDVLLALFVVLVTGISGWVTTKSQFSQYWFYLVPLAIGFGVQVGLYVYLREVVKRMMSKKVMAVTGSTSTAAMISCCAHYLVNILPIISASGVAAFVGQYQVQLFWVGLAFNVFGIVLIARKVIRFRRHLTTAAVSAPASHPLKPWLNNAVVITAFIMVIGGVWLAAGRTKVDSASGSVQAAVTDLTRTSDQNGMTVAVTPKQNADGSWDFAVTIDNHVVNVTQDMVAVSSLTDTAGQIVKPQAWTGDPPGGHHRSGMLKFGPQSSSPASLTIRELGGVPARTFTWDNLGS